MLNKNEAFKLVEAKIVDDEAPGRRADSSGETGRVDFKILQVDGPVEIAGRGGTFYKLTYTYLVMVTLKDKTGKDRGPFEFQFRKSLRLNRMGEIVAEGAKVLEEAAELPEDLEMGDHFLYDGENGGARA